MLADTERNVGMAKGNQRRVSFTETMAARCERRTGIYVVNLLQGSVSTAIGIKPTASNLLASFIVEKSAYDAAFLSLAVIAVAACLVFWRWMPETGSSLGASKAPEAPPTKKTDDA